MELIDGVLLLYNHPISKNASTIMEHVNSFSKHSDFKVWNLNTEMGFPNGLSDIKFKVVVLHYSLFGTRKYCLNKKFYNYLDKCNESYKIAFFQDEHHFCQQRFHFLNRYKIDCVYSLFEEEYFDVVYYKNTNVKKVVFTLTGYVSNELINISKKHFIPFDKRKLDIGYRARKLPYYMGKGAQEKAGIADGIKQRVDCGSLVMDIETGENKRIYGEDWYRFLANCRSVLGVESGVSIVDLNDEVMAGYHDIIRKNPKISFDEMYDMFLYKWDGNIFYRAISPRIFEAAALRVCQIMFEGKYNNIVQPMIHYIPLKKDFSNLDEVLEIFQNSEKRNEIVENAYQELIGSGKYTYASFVRGFDNELIREGFAPASSTQQIEIVDNVLKKGGSLRIIKAYVMWPLNNYFPGKQLLKKTIMPLYRYFLQKDKT